MTIDFPLYQVDSFTDQVFKGNPAGVCLLSEPQPDEWMKQVAAEMNLSETAFLLMTEDGFNLRWFTPQVEVDLCGHATLASAHILYETGLIAKDQTIRFHTRSGLLQANIRKDWLELDFPARKVEATGENERLIEAVVIPPDEVYKTAENMLYYYEDEQVIRRMQPDFARIASVSIHGLIVTAPSGNPSFDFISRYFAPAIGINEDPVTGSAHCSLAPFWQQRLHKDTLIGYQASKRGGTVKVRVSGERVYLSGQAVTVFATHLKS